MRHALIVDTISARVHAAHLSFLDEKNGENGDKDVGSTTPSSGRYVAILMLACLLRLLVPPFVSLIVDAPGSGHPVKYSMQVGVILMLLNEWLNFVFLAVLFRRRIAFGARSPLEKLAVVVATAIWLSSAAFSWFVQYPATLYWIDVDRSLPGQALQPFGR